MQNKDFNILPDETLVAMAQEGSATAFDFLIKKYRTMAMGKVRDYYMAGWDEEDIVQEGLIGIYKAIRDFDSEAGSSFKTFVNLCITRQIQSAVTGANRQKHKILNESLSLHLEKEEDQAIVPLCERIPSCGDGSNPLEEMLVVEAIKSFCSEDNSLLSPLETLVWNEMLRGKTYIEIAEELDKSPKSIDNAMQRIKKKLREILE